MRVVVLLLALTARLSLGLGPEDLVLCLHASGSVEVESVTALCCDRPSCASTRVPGAAASRQPEDESDDCQDFAFATGDAVLHAATATVESPTAVAFLALPVSVARPEFPGHLEKAGVAARSRGDPRPLAAPRLVTLRC